MRPQGANPNRITTDEAPDESQALLFYTRQAEPCSSADAVWNNNESALSALRLSVDDGPRRKGKRSAAT